MSCDDFDSSGGQLMTGTAQPVPIIIKRKPVDKSSSEQAAGRTDSSRNNTGDVGVQRLCLPPAMSEPCSLLSADRQSPVLTSVERWLSADNPHFLVVAAVGLQGVGKSTLLSLLANQLHSSRSRQCVFGTQSVQNACHGWNTTSGIDVYVTPYSRMILLDSQPLLSTALLEQSSRHSHSDLSSYAELEMIAIEHLCFLMSVCHVLLLVQEFFTDPTLLRLIQAADMLKPAVGGGDGGVSGGGDAAPHCHTPRLLLVQNRCSTLQCQSASRLTISVRYSRSLSLSTLQWQSARRLTITSMYRSLFSAMSLTSASLSSSVPAAADDNDDTRDESRDVDDYVITVFVPHLSTMYLPGSIDRDEIGAHVAAELSGCDSDCMDQCVEDFILAVSSVAPRSLIAPGPQTMTETQWLKHAVKVWDSIQTCSEIKEFVRMSS